MRNARLVFITLLALLTAGCPQPKEKKTESNVILYKGDPKAFFEGTRRTTSSPFREGLLDEKGNYQLSMSIIKNIIDKDQRTFEAVKKAQTPGAMSKDFSTEFTKNFSFGRDIHDGSLWLSNPKTDGMKLQFEMRSGAWALRKITTNQDQIETGKDFELLHYSITPDASVFSLLIYTVDKDEKNLISLYFVKDRGALDRLVDLAVPFEYLLGRGIRSAWNSDQPIQIEYCTPGYPEPMRKWFTDSVAVWSAQLKGRAALISSSSNNCPPFSDVNTHGFHYIEGWIEIPGDSGTIGVTRVVNRGSELIDGDVFMMMGELQESIDLKYGRGRIRATDYIMISDPHIQSLMASSVLHEMGHFLGLHHIFDGTTSVMSYENTTYLTTYDRNAIQALYPLKTTLSEYH